jgi:predicted ATPase/Flp pilus assembly protein TadD
MLIVLDNFEHLVAHANLLADMLKSAPNIKLLVTSRESLRLRGEQIYEVPPLGMASVKDSLDAMGGACASQLFIQSAKRVMPDFEFDEVTAPHVVRICALVGGLPLGIELSAAWLEMLPLDEIGDEIEKSLDFLETDLRDVPERQRSLRAVFDYSWNLLTDDEKEVFTKLAMFKGGFEREAAQKIAGASLRILTSLVNKSLVQRYPNGRYGLNKVLMQYAVELLKKRSDVKEVKKSHALYFGELLEKSTPLFNTRKEKMAVEMMDTEWENIRFAIHCAIDMGACDEIGKVSYTLLMYYINRSLFQEGSETFHKLATMIKDNRGEDELYWRIRVYQAWLLSRMGDYADSWELAHPAEAYFKANQHVADMSETLNLLSYIAMMQGEYAQSVAYAEEAITYAPQSRQEHMTWYMSRGNLGYAEFLRGNQQQALAIYEDIVKRLHEADDYSPNGMGYMLNNLGEILRTLGRFEEANKLFQESYEIFEANNIKRGMAFTLNNIGGIRIAEEDNAAAQPYYQRAYELNKEIGDQNGIAHSLSALGNNELYLGNIKEAKAYYEKSLRIRRRMGERRGIADSLTDLGRANAAMNDYQTALNHFIEAEKIYTDIQELDGLGSALVNIASTQAMLKNFDMAYQKLNEARALGERLNSGFMMMVVVFISAELAILENRLDDAEASLNQLSTFRSEMSYIIKLLLLGQKAEILAKRGQLGASLEILLVFRANSEKALGFLRMFAPFVLQQLELFERELNQNFTSEVWHKIETQAKTQSIDALFEHWFGLAVN